MLNSLKFSRQTNEEAFTLLELVIVIIIIGILAAIAIPVFANQQNSAIEARIKSDVKNNSSLMLGKGNNNKLYLTTDEFIERVISSDENTVNYYVNSKQNKACISVSGIITNNETVTYHLNTSASKITEGQCEMDGLTSYEGETWTSVNTI